MHFESIWRSVAGCECSLPIAAAKERRLVGSSSVYIHNFGWIICVNSQVFKPRILIFSLVESTKISKNKNPSEVVVLSAVKTISGEFLTCSQ